MAKRPPRLGSWWIRAELACAAFAPALALMAFRARHTAWLWPFVLLAAFGVVVLIRGAVVVARGNPEAVLFGDIDDEAKEVLGHVSAYLLPVVVDTRGPPENVWISAIVLAIIIHIHISTGRIFVNPLLYLFGYRIYLGHTSGTTFYLVARTDVATWSGPRRCVSIGSSVLVEKGHG